jgi:hypothetical protein
VFKGAKTNIHRIAAGSLANLPCFRVLGNPARCDLTALHG